MASNPQVQKLRSDINKKLHEKNAITDALEKIETKTGVDRLYLVGGVVGIASLYLIFGYFAELVCNFIGFLYPAYMSIKAIESPTKEDDTQWLTYWVIFALFSVLEFAADAFVGWFPVYWLLKCAAMLYLHLPMTMGAQTIYTKFVRPFIVKHEKTIDERLGSVLGKAKEVTEEFRKAD